jgi:CHASE2 domain-containing sensor protein/predicted Ser/Thr protein kinase
MLASFRNLLTQPAVFASAIVSVLLVGAQQLGLLEHPELIVFDQMMQSRADVEPDKRLLIVGFTENDIQNLKQSSPNGNVLTTVLSKLEQYQAKVIGLDFFRDVPIEPGHQKLLSHIKQSSRIVSICKLGDEKEPAVPPPEGVASETAGFADFSEDGDGVIRRNLLIAFPNPNSKCAAQGSLGFQLAVQYLNITPEITEKRIILGNTVFQRLEPDSGNYRNLDNRGFQILLNYGSKKSIAPQVSFTDVLGDRINPSLVKNRIVLIGSTALSSQDVRVTPYSSGNKQDNSGKMPGVVIHAQMVSQILDAVSNKRRLFWFLPEWGEVLWIWGWALVGGVVASRIQHPLYLGLTTTASLAIVLLSCFAIFTEAGWVPVVSPILGFLVTQGGVLAYTSFQNKQQKEKVALQIQDQNETISLLQSLLRDGGSHRTQTQGGVHNGLQLQGILNHRYKIIELLGCGGFSYTYLAEDIYRPGNPLCVVKYLQPARNDELFLDVARRLFKSEAEILETLGQHEQIPQLMAYFEENKQFYLVQEYIQGHSLHQELTPGKRFSDAQVVHFLKDVLQILAFVHSHGVIHRDIKPSNLMHREKDQRTVLIDFGAVKQIQPQHPTENPTVAVGTIGYSPPEQFMGQPRLNSDIFALGMIAIQALTGTPAKYLERDSTTTELVWRHLTETREDLAAVLDKMVCYDFRKRYQFVEEVLYSLRNF